MPTPALAAVDMKEAPRLLTWTANHTKQLNYWTNPVEDECAQHGLEP